MNIDDMKVSTYLTKEECSPPIRVVISKIDQDNLAKDGEAPEMKFILHFHGDVKPMVLNITNGKLIAMVLSSKETNDWIGKEIILWNDPSVSFGDKLTGGIRVQIPQQDAVVAGAAPAQPTGEMDDDIPF